MTSGARGEGARERIILTAERLFAQRGINGVSLREIGAEAGQRNNSASQYHFGSKAGLIEAIFALRMGAINVRRLEVLAALDEAGAGYDLRGLVEACIHPLAESLDDSEGERWYVRFLANAFAEPLGSQLWAEHRGFTSSIDEVRRRLDVVLADLPDAVRSERLAALLLMVIHVLAGREGAAAGTPGTRLLVADLVDMGVGLLATPISSETTRQLAAVETEGESDGDPGGQSDGANVKSEQATSASVTSAPVGPRVIRTQATSPDIEIS